MNLLGLIPPLPTWNDDKYADVERDLEADEDTVEVEELRSPDEGSGAPTTQLLLLHLGSGYTGFLKVAVMASHVCTVISDFCENLPF